MMPGGSVIVLLLVHKKNENTPSNHLNFDAPSLGQNMRKTQFIPHLQFFQSVHASANTLSVLEAWFYIVY